MFLHSVHPLRRSVPAAVLLAGALLLVGLPGPARAVPRICDSVGLDGVAHEVVLQGDRWDRAPDDGSSPEPSLPESNLLTLLGLSALGLLGYGWQRRRLPAAL